MDVLTNPVKENPVKIPKVPPIAPTTATILEIRYSSDTFDYMTIRTPMTFRTPGHFVHPDISYTDKGWDP